MVIYGWKNLLDRDALERDPIAELVRIYKETNERATTDPTVREAARQELVKLQAGDPENFSIWKEMRRSFHEGIRARLQMLDIHYDIQRGESFYNDRLPAVVERLLKSGIAEISEGAVCVFFRDIPELAESRAIIRKSDGGFNYATTDIATVDYRIKDLKADTVWLGRRRAADPALQTDLRDRAPRRLHGRFPPHHFWQHSRRRPQADEDALGRKRAAARCARGSDRARPQNHRGEKSGAGEAERDRRSRKRSGSAR